MKEYVAKRSRHGMSKTDIIAINTMAKKDAQNGNKVINASIGTFLDDEKKVGGIALVNEALKNHVTDKMGYPGVLGDPDYLNSVMHYVFKDKLETIESLYHPFIGATLGGTGAISHTFNLFLEEGDAVLLPDVMWTNYKLIASKAHAVYETYKMFDDKGEIDFSSLRKIIQSAREKYHRSVLVINDPCQNPTGYCMTEEEYDTLFSLLDEEGKKGYLTVLFDIAYFSFFHIEGHKCALMDKLIEKRWDFLPLIAFSCSKIFGCYGLRMGALIALCPNEENKEEISRGFGALTRGTYSVPVGSVQYAVSTVLDDKKKASELDAEILANSLVLKQRSDVLLSELKKARIEHYPYKCGFFITLKVKNAFEVTEELKEKHDYVVPMNENSIRLAISGMTKEEISKLVSDLSCAISHQK